MLHNFSKNPQIYLITNLINGKSYVGQHKGVNKHYFAGGILVKKAIKKYGKSNFSRIIIEDGDFTDEELNQKELFYIKKYNTVSPNGYNISTDGTGKYNRGSIPWNKGGSKYTPETIEKMKEAKKIHPHSEEGKKAISESNKRRFNSGELTTFQLHTPEVKFKTKEILSKKTIEYDLEGNFVKIWDSATDAEKFYNIFGVSECCRGIIKSSGNRIFRYFEENYPMKIEVDLDIITRTVLMIDNNMNIIKQFKNVKEAANWIFDNLNTEKRKLKKIDSLIMSLRSILRKECFYRGYYWKWGSHPKKKTTN